MEAENFINLLSKKDLSLVDSQELDVLVKKYPWFDLVRLLHLLKTKQCDNKISDDQLKDTAIYFHDRRTLYKLLNTDYRSELKKNYFNSDASKKTEAVSADKDSAKDLLDFSYQNKSEEIKNDEKEIQTKEVSEESNAKSLKPNLIEQFLTDEPGVIPANKKTSLIGDVSKKSILESEHLLTDTLARIYINQGLFNKAIFAYEKLSLKYPEKSVYFASQIKEIKEIINKK